MWTLPLYVMVWAAAHAGAICPSRCRCNEDDLRVTCASSSLEVVPIQLNPEIRRIDLSANRIRNVHFTLTFYAQLVHLDLSGNRIETLGTANFETQRNLLHLNLSGNQVETLGKDTLKGLRALVELDLSGNRLERIGAHALRDLHSLSTLDLSGNQIGYMQEGVFKANTMLKVLRLEGNQLLDIPVALSDAINLQSVSLSRNLIAYISGMPALTGLHTLKLDSNVLSEIHSDGMSGLTGLERLDLSDNNFTAIPTLSLAKLSNLTQLKFSGNFIQTVPPVAFRGLFQLKHLRIDGLDFLTRIDPRAFVDNINLEAIWLDDNIAITDLPTRLFHGNPRVTQISVRNNRLELLHATHFPLDQLNRLNLGGNPLQCNCSLLWLWKLAREQTTNNNTSTNELFMDVEDITCSGPEHLHAALLVDTSETQMGCYQGWITFATAALFVLLIIAVIALVLYCGPLKKRLRQTDNPPIEDTIHPNLSSNIYEDPRDEKYEYKTLPTWDGTYHKDIFNRPYESVITRPHIVYV